MQTRYRRPAGAAKYLDCSISQFWHLAKTDPSFPELKKLSPRVTVVDTLQLDQYVERKSNQAEGSGGKKAKA